MTSTPVKHRLKANPIVDVDSYIAMCRVYFLADPIATVDSRLGPRLLCDLRSCTPTTMSRIAPLLQSFLDGGLASGVVNSLRLERSLVELLGRNPGLGDRDKLAYQVTNHVVSHLALLRCFKREYQPKTSSLERQYPNIWWVPAQHVFPRLGLARPSLEVAAN